MTPNTSGAAGARDGNAAANRQPLNAIVDLREVPAGGQFWIRWTEVVAREAGANNGLAFDDFSLRTFAPIPEAPTFWSGMAVVALGGGYCWRCRRRSG